MTANTEIIDPLIIPNDMIQSSGAIYDELYKKITVFGTFENPLFIAKEIQTILGLQNMRYAGKDSYLEWDIDRIKRRIINPIDNKPGEVILLTESGLYVAIGISISPVANAFRRYIYTVMKQLRINGVVTTESAAQGYQKYQQEIAEKQKELEEVTAHRNKISKQLDDELETVSTCRKDTIRLNDALLDFKLEIKDDKPKEEPEEVQEEVPDYETLLTKIKRHYMNRVYLVLHELPKTKQEHGYEFDSITYEDLGYDVHYISFSTVPVDTTLKRSIKCYLIHDPYSLLTIQSKLVEHDTPVRSNVFQTSIGNVEDIICTLNNNASTHWVDDDALLLEGIYSN
jgi:prophage antirepressor-like protein